MPDAEKQEGQKTVVAFITGLLIGGLLVWVFSSTPDEVTPPENEEVTTEEKANTSTNTQSASVSTATTNTNTSSDGKGSLSVDDQPAGKTVILGKTSYPDENGWIVVRDYANGAVGNILGAARYSTTEGLTPTKVTLLRSTVAGKTYTVMFHSENGDKKFSSADDKPMEAGSTTFEAE
jgi:cytoskeletal protein RodZ